MIPPRRIDGAELRAAREFRGFRPSQVADEVQISRSFYLRLERGDRTSSNSTTAARLAALLDVPVKQITRPVVSPQQQRSAAA